MDGPAPPTSIEPPPTQPAGMGCLTKGMIALILLALLLVLGIYLFVAHGLVSSARVNLPVEELPPGALSALHQRIDEFQNTPPAPVRPTPAPTVAPQSPAVAGQTPTPSPATEKELVLSAGEINGLISANKKSRGHAFVSLAGDTATVSISIPSDKVPSLPRGFLNGSFRITTNGPTPISALQVSKIRAGGMPVPSSILGMSYNGQSLLSYALSGTAPYNVSTAEIRDGSVVLH